MIQTKFEWFLILISLLVVIFDWLFYWSFTKSLKKPFKKTKWITYISGFKDTQDLYASYNKLSVSDFKAMKRFLKGFDFSNNLASQIADLMAKLVFTIFLALITFVATVTNTNINFINSHQEQFLNLTKSFSDNFETIKSLLENFSNVFLTSIALFCVTLSHTMLLNLKRILHRRHLSIIEEIEEDRKK